jgi:uncharacterized paraquat-inducible protein A
MDTQNYRNRMAKPLTAKCPECSMVVEVQNFYLDRQHKTVCNLCYAKKRLGKDK